MNKYYEIGLVAPKMQSSELDESLEGLMRQLASGDFRARLKVEMPTVFSPPSMKVYVWLLASTFPSDLNGPDPEMKALTVTGESAREALECFQLGLIGAYGTGAEISYVMEIDSE